MAGRSAEEIGKRLAANEEIVRMSWYSRGSGREQREWVGSGGCGDSVIATMAVEVGSSHSESSQFVRVPRFKLLHTIGLRAGWLLDCATI
jgi:hypothetical protein